MTKCMMCSNNKYTAPIIDVRYTRLNMISIEREILCQDCFNAKIKDNPVIIREIHIL